MATPRGAIPADFRTWMRSVERRLRTLGSAAAVVPGIGGEGVQSVNDIEPDDDGNVTLAASDVGADEAGAASDAQAAAEAASLPVTTTLDQVPHAAAPVDCGGQEFTDAADPSADQSLVTRAWAIANLSGGGGGGGIGGVGGGHWGDSYTSFGVRGGSW